MPATQLIEEVHRFRRTLIVVGAVFVVLFITGGWWADYRSCKRQVPIRQALIEDANIARASVAYWEKEGRPEVAQRARERAENDGSIKTLDCLQPLPGV